MVKQEAAVSDSATLNTPVQGLHTYEERGSIPASAVLLEVLKALEEQLQLRGFIEDPATLGIHPIWFLAETERNVYLWRNGASLAALPSFEFWIDVNGLVAKRLKQLDNYDPENPFINPLWSLSSLDAKSLQHERAYLQNLREVFLSIEGHAHALSQVGSHFRDEISKTPRSLVVIPAAP
jgi:hypothetical protein